MARFTGNLIAPMPCEKAFDLLSAFERTAEWDPGVAEAERLTPGPVGVGTRFRVVALFFGRRLEMLYTVTQMDAPNRIVLRGESDTALAEDEILVTPHPDPGSDSCQVTWDARVSLKGVLYLGDPLLQLAFQRVGRKALSGLADALGARKG